MNLDELIERLLDMKREYGSIKVEAYNSAGDYDDVGSVIAKPYVRQSETRWIVFIDT